MTRRSWTQAASIEETLALWAASLREIKKRIRPLFTQERVAANAGLFLEGLLGDERRKTGWMRAEAAGDPGPWRQQAILGRGDWDADALRYIVRDYVIEHLADDDAVLVIDETGFLKQGKASCGVARQYTGSAGKITNCQIGVFAELPDRRLRYLRFAPRSCVDRTLYLPKEWTDDPDRLEAAYVPPNAGFATKPKLATRMIARAIAASVPFKWVAGDTVYGVGDIEQHLRRAGKGYVLGVSSAHVFRSWGKRPPVAGTAADIARTRRSSDWKRLSAGAGTKGPRLHGWCYLELADLEAEQFSSANDGLWTRGLLIRRRIADDDLKPRVTVIGAEDVGIRLGASSRYVKSRVPRDALDGAFSCRASGSISRETFGRECDGHSGCRKSQIYRAMTTYAAPTFVPHGSSVAPVTGCYGFDHGPFYSPHSCIIPYPCAYYGTCK
jgi:SRSO17 transposase